MFKRLLCAVLVLMMLVSEAVAEAPVYILLEGISWQSTPEEVKQILGDGAVLEEEWSEIVGKLTVVGREGGSVAGIECVQTQFIFHDDAAMSASCFFTGEQLPDSDALVEALSAVYGEAEAREENTYSLDEFIMSMSSLETVCDWKIGDTEITLLDCGDAYTEYCYSLSFVNLPVAEAFDETMNAWLEYAESEG